MKLKKIKNTRILVAMLLIFTMVFFAGCGGNDEPLDDGTDTNPPVTDNNVTDSNDNMMDDNTLNDNGTMDGTDGVNNTTDDAMDNNAVQ